jgi:DNA-binding response OmpR family regulator
MSAADPRLRRLLVVDDEVAIVSATCTFLREAGFEADGACEREEAEAMLAVRDYGLLIVDIALSGGHGREGLELLRQLRARRPAARAIVLTACSTPELEAEARRCGAGAVLHKPVPLGEVAVQAAVLLE